MAEYAEALLIRALKIEPESAITHFNLGLLKAGDMAGRDMFMLTVINKKSRANFMTLPSKVQY